MLAGILTFHSVNNYGAVLQNYALQRAVEKCGWDAETIDYQCDYIEKPYRLINLKQKGLIPYGMGIGGHFIYSFRNKKTNNFRKLVKYSPPVCKKDMQSLNDNYDLFITGSDQVWNHNLTNFDTTFFLDFVHDSRKKASYAASIGLEHIDRAYCEDYKNLLDSFRYLSVREKTAADIIENLINRRPDIVADPTLLLTPEEWFRVADMPTIKEKYILVYQLAFCADTLKFAQKLAKQTGYKVVCLPFPMGKLIHCKCGLTQGPSELLGLIKHAEYVITPSFHGMIFSILFQKQFFVERPSGVCRQVTSRVKGLLNELGLSDRMLQSGEESIAKFRPIDYTDIVPLVDQKRKQSMAYLKNMLCEKE